MKIKICKTEQGDGGYMFDIWRNEDVGDDESSDDGGFCTGTYQDAVDMACAQAKDLIKNQN